MKSIPFNIPSKEFNSLSKRFHNTGNNSHVGNFAVEIVQLYFKSLDAKAKFILNIAGVDLYVTYKRKKEKYEIKGTADPKISWGKLKISSQPSHDAIINGMPIIRVTNIGQKSVTLHFMKVNEDFTVHPEVRWTLRKKK